MSDWRLHALCAEYDSELFVGEVPDERKAKSICARCDVRDECLTFALTTYSRHGVWGGKTEAERRAIARRLTLPRAEKQYRAGSPGPKGRAA